MKWFKRLALAFTVVVVAAIVFAVGTARRSEKPVGFQVVRVESANGPVAVALWYPTAATPRPTTFINGSLLSVAKDGPVAGNALPLIVMSHGNNGAAVSHFDLAMDLASAGYVVAAPTHAGDNFADQSRQGEASLFTQRAEQIRATTDYVLSTWASARQVDPTRVGAFGFSAGAFTVLGLVGGVPDMASIARHCARQPEFICEVLAQTRSPLLTAARDAPVFVPDPRIKAAAIAAPGLGFTFGDGALAEVGIPVQVWSGSNDATVPFETNTRIVLAGLGPHAEARVLAGASHLSFLAPCGLLGSPVLCSDPAGFDRASSHRRMNADVIRFFNTRLAPPGARGTP